MTTDPPPGNGAGVPVPLRSEGIRLGQFLKLVDAVESGSDVKALLAAGSVAVNGEAETRRGRQLARGDTVTVDEQVFEVE